MNVEVEDLDGIKVVHVTGELTGGDTDALIEAVSNLLSDRQASIALDLAGVSFVNSAGLGDLVRLKAQANVQEARLIIANPSAYLRGVLEMTKLDKFLEAVDTVEEAIRTLTA